MDKQQNLLWKTDLEIAHAYKIQNISDIASRGALACEDLNLYGNYMAKSPLIK